MQFLNFRDRTLRKDFKVLSFVSKFLIQCIGEVRCLRMGFMTTRYKPGSKPGARGVKNCRSVGGNRVHQNFWNLFKDIPKWKELIPIKIGPIGKEGM